MDAVTKHTVFEFFNGQSTPMQKQMIEEWLQKDAHTELYYEWQEEWEKQHLQYVADTEQALNQFKKRINIDSGAANPAEVPERKTSLFFTKGRKYAAAASVFLGMLTAYVFKDELLYKQYNTGNGETRTIILEDSTTVTLNEDAGLKVSRFFNLGRTRKVFFTGNASFHVRHLADNRSFIIKLPNHFSVEVLGTEFDLLALKDSSRVYLHKGSVRLSNQNNSMQPVMMHPGDLVNINKLALVRLRKGQFYWQYNVWKSHVFTFNSIPLTDVVKMLNEQFGKNILIEDTTLGNRIISGSYAWQKEDDILTTLSEMMGFRILQNESQTLLR